MHDTGSKEVVKGWGEAGRGWRAYHGWKRGGEGDRGAATAGKVAAMDWCEVRSSCVKASAAAKFLVLALCRRARHRGARRLSSSWLWTESAIRSCGSGRPLRLCSFVAVLVVRRLCGRLSLRFDGTHFTVLEWYTENGDLV